MCCTLDGGSEQDKWSPSSQNFSVVPWILPIYKNLSVCVKYTPTCYSSGPFWIHILHVSLLTYVWWCPSYSRLGYEPAKGSYLNVLHWATADLQEASGSISKGSVIL